MHNRTANCRRTNRKSPGLYKFHYPPPPIISIMQREKINITAVTETKASIIPITADDEETIEEIFLFPKKLPIPQAAERQRRHNRMLTIGGTKITAITIMAYTPRIFFVRLRQLLTVASASETDPPTIGIALPTMNFAVLESTPSEEEVTSVPRPIIPEKTAIKEQSTHIAKLFTDFDISSIFIEETEPVTQKAR